MANTGNIFPGTGENVDRAGLTAWTAPGDIVSDNAADATCNATGSDYLVARNFGFSLPAGSTILGVLVRVEASEHSGGTEPLLAQLQDAAGALVGASKSTSNEGSISGTAKAIYTYGSTSDLWSAALTEAMVEDPDFGVRLWFTTAHDVRIDFVTIAIEYAEYANGAGTTKGQARTIALTTGTGAVAGPARGEGRGIGAAIGTGAMAGATRGQATASATRSASGAVAGMTRGMATAVALAVGIGAVAGTGTGSARSSATPSAIAGAEKDVLFRCGAAAAMTSPDGTITEIVPIAGSTTGYSTAYVTVSAAAAAAATPPGGGAKPRRRYVLDQPPPDRFQQPAEQTPEPPQRLAEKPPKLKCAGSVESVGQATGAALVIIPVVGDAVGPQPEASGTVVWYDDQDAVDLILQVLS